MARNYISNLALCPYYQMEDAKSITCEGIGPGWVIKVSRDGHEGNAKDHIRKYCYDRWEECPVARMLDEKYK